MSENHLEPSVTPAATPAAAPAATVPADSSGKALISAFAAYISWGLLPLFWKTLAAVNPLQLLSCRIVFSLLFVWPLLAARGDARWPRLFLNRKARRSLLLSATFIAVNWGVYIWAINSGHAVEASLGYYMNPLVNVLLGLFFFKEKLKSLQWVAFILAATGVALLTAMAGSPPWIALTLAFSFALYGMVKKAAQLDSLAALGAETLLLFPLSLAYLAFAQFGGRGAFDGSWTRTGLLVVSGGLTALPLFWFARGAKRLPLSLMGFIQMISPSLQLALAVLVFKEPFPAARLTAFIFIWIALVVYSLSYLTPKPKPGA